MIILRTAGPIRISAVSTLRRVALLVIPGSGAVTAQLIGETTTAVRFRSGYVSAMNSEENHACYFVDGRVSEDAYTLVPEDGTLKIDIRLC